MIKLNPYLVTVISLCTLGLIAFAYTREYYYLIHSAVMLFAAFFWKDLKC